MDMETGTSLRAFHKLISISVEINMWGKLDHNSSENLESKHEDDVWEGPPYGILYVVGGLGQVLGLG